MTSPIPAQPESEGVFAPLKHALFRRIWLASLLSNFGMLIMGVGAAWAMTQMTSSSDQVALVQAALMLPVALFSTAAGAIADMYDRRVVSLISLVIAVVGSTAMTALAWTGHMSPPLLLVFCFVVGTGMALFGPSWQASVSEQVPLDAVPAAVALNGISYNIARSFGPAIGGFIVAALGAVAAFAINAVLYLPLLAVMFLWKRRQEPSRLPPERLGRAVVSGVRFVTHSPQIRVVLGRTVVTSFAGAAILALMPLVARDLLGGGATLYGFMLGSFGMGAVIGALNMQRLKARFHAEASVRVCALAMGTGIGIVALSHWPYLTSLALLLVGAAWTASMTNYNIAVQLSAPRWVAGRALAAFQASVAGGVALGSWVWGSVSHSLGVATALVLAGAVLAASPLLSRWMRMPSIGSRSEAAADILADPEVRLSLTPRSGPIVVEIEYRVDPARARLFYAVMQQVEHSRQRNGAYGWSLARDIADPELWTERFHCPTWYDYLRQRNRSTDAERALHARAMDFHMGPEPVRIRRMLERPIGSVRWKETTPDRPSAEVVPVASVAGGISH